MDHHTWLSLWRADITAAVATMTSTFEATHGYPLGVNEVRVATEAARPGSGRDHESLATYGLAAFYDSIGEVALGDVGNGYFVHSAHDVTQRFVEEGPVVISESERGLVFASNGGGTHYVIDQQGAIHRSRAMLKTCGSVPGGHAEGVPSRMIL
ncbi:hypothetical protein ACWEQL_27865 [Kitasatospora sp. NPDC004240]